MIVIIGVTQGDDEYGYDSIGITTFNTSAEKILGIVKDLDSTEGKDTVKNNMVREPTSYWLLCAWFMVRGWVMVCISYTHQSIAECRFSSDVLKLNNNAQLQYYLWLFFLPGKLHLGKFGILPEKRCVDMYGGRSMAFYSFNVSQNNYDLSSTSSCYRASL